jgi:hypothetical protein
LNLDAPDINDITFLLNENIKYYNKNKRLKFIEKIDSQRKELENSK